MKNCQVPVQDEDMRFLNSLSQISRHLAKKGRLTSEQIAGLNKTIYRTPHTGTLSWEETPNWKLLLEDPRM